MDGRIKWDGWMGRDGIHGMDEVHGTGELDEIDEHDGDKRERFGRSRGLCPCIIWVFR